MTLIAQVSRLARIISNQVLLPNFALLEVEIKPDGSWLSEADLEAHDRLVEELTKLVDCPVLSEEMSEQEQQQVLDKHPQNYWCIDPLDGTSNYIQGIPYWCMSIALIQNGKIALGVVYDPNRDECFSAQNNVSENVEDSQTIFIDQEILNGQKILNDQKIINDQKMLKDQTMLNGQIVVRRKQTAQSLEDCMGLIDFKRLSPSKVIDLITHQPYRSQRSFGASALDLCWIATDRCQLYLHGKQKIWDHAAGLLILKNAGGFAETFNGQSIFDNDLQNKSVIAASNKQLMTQWKEYFNSM